MKIFSPHEYQHEGAAFMLNNPFGGALYDPGLGKTATVIMTLLTLRSLGQGHRALVIAPRSVSMTVWQRELLKWAQFAGLKIATVVGDEKTRIAALAEEADIYVTNVENVAWLSELMRHKLRVRLRKKRRELKPGKRHASLTARIARVIEAEKSREWGDFFDVLIVDESTRFKSASSTCFKRLKSILDYFDRRYILTGDFFENSLEDLWSQVYILDKGERLEKKIGDFKSRFGFFGGFKNREWVAFPESRDKILGLIQDITHRLDADDWLNLPPLIFNDVWVDLDAKTQKIYDEFEAELFVELPEARQIKEDGERGGTIATLSAAGRYLLCRQIANGGAYADDVFEEPKPGKDRESLFLHDAKVQATESIVNELNGKPVLILYQFWHDLRRLESVFGVRPCLNSDTKSSDFDSIVTGWNNDDFPILFAQPQSMSHGLNLQEGSGRDVVFFGLTDSLGVYLQAYKRIYRQGVDSPVRVHRILTRRTVDRVMVNRVDGKAKYQKSILNALRAYSQERRLVA